MEVKIISQVLVDLLFDNLRTSMTTIGQANGPNGLKSVQPMFDGCLFQLICKTNVELKQILSLL